MDRTAYENPLTDRYASKEMSYLWSPQCKFSTWRRIWLALATAQRELGLDVSEAQIAELRAHLDDINFADAERLEKQLRHDVMSHIHALGLLCPTAKPIIHLGATSCDVTDNTELYQLRESLRLLRGRLLRLMTALRQQAWQHRALPTLGFTHYQPAQVTTVGKRLCLYMQDFLLDYRELELLLARFPFRGIKGATGTQATYMELFKGDHAKVLQLERRVAEQLGFDPAHILPISGQTYTRKLDYQVVGVLSGIAQSTTKMATDLRLLINLKELDEPFEAGQVGSSAMAYKRNPMRCERLCGLSRYLISLAANPAHTAANQWLERTLDDSSNRRLVLPEACLTTDILLGLATNVVDGLVLWPKVIQRHLQAELPFMATEVLLMAAVQAGGDRQDLHEAIRTHSLAAAKVVKEEGGDNDLLARLAADPAFAAVKDQLPALMDARRFVGRAPQQVEDFLARDIDPLLAAHASDVSRTVSKIEV